MSDDLLQDIYDAITSVQYMYRGDAVRMGALADRVEVAIKKNKLCDEPFKNGEDKHD